MEIKYKMFPYPVLTEFSDDYIDSKFDVRVEEAIHGYDRKLYFGATLKNSELMQLIEEGKAQFVYHLECSETGFREVIQTSDKMKDYLLFHEKVCGKLQICPFIVAAQDIQGYTNKCFHPDYSGISFNIETGCVLAVAAPRTIIIEKEIDDLAHIPSIFSIIKNLDPNITYMTVEISGDRIVIQLPTDDFAKYSLINQGSLLSETLNSMVVVPAIIYVLEEIKHVTPDERYQYEDGAHAWYMTLKKVLMERFNCDIGSSEFEAVNTVELAQRIIDEPMHKALDSLIALGENQNGGTAE